jgi:N-acyl-D-amino-acid deacylase
MDFDILVKNALVYDGTGLEPYKKDIGIISDKIAIVSGNIKSTSSNIIDASGMILCPGFIDVHTHDDFAVFYNPEMKCKINQGVTTSIVGNCGFSVSPYKNALEHTILYYNRQQMPQWDSHSSYLECFDNQPASINIGLLAGHGTIRYAVMGTSELAPNKKQLGQIHRVIENAVTYGVLGLSLGLAYIPGKFALSKELIDTLDVIKGSSVLLTAHVRDEGAKLLEAIKETVDIADKTDLPVQISHFKASGKENYHLLKDAISIIDKANDSGKSVTVDLYSYNSGSTSLKEILNWGLLSADKNIEKMFSIEPSDIIVMSSEKFPHYIGKTIEDISLTLNKNCESAANIISEMDPDIIIALCNCISNKNIELILKTPYSMIGSDGIPTKTGYANPRLYGTFPRLIRKFIKEKNVLSLSTAIYKMTGFPAKRFGLKNRGIIKEGAFADLVLFDYEKIADKGTYQNTKAFPDGISNVFVNGVHVLKDGVHTGKRAGRALRNNF